MSIQLQNTAAPAQSPAPIAPAARPLRQYSALELMYGYYDQE